MKAETGAMVSELFGGLFGWIWIASFIATPVLIGWAVFGEGRWYYPLIAFLIGGFCKSLCREYWKQTQDLLHESTGKDYAAEWIALPEEEKKEEVVEAFKAIAIKYHPAGNVDALVEEYNNSNRFTDMVNEITEGCNETGLNKPYWLACRTFMDNYFLAVANEPKNSRLEDNRNAADKRVKVIQDFGGYIESNPTSSIMIRDASELPHPKEDILNAILLELINEDDENQQELLKMGADMLAEFQEGVGPKPLTMLGVDHSEMLGADKNDPEKMKQVLEKIANNPDKERFKALSKVAEKERNEIQSKIMAAEELRGKMSEQKKREVLGKDA